LIYSYQCDERAATLFRPSARRGAASAKCVTPAGVHETNHCPARRAIATRPLAICMRILSHRWLRQTESDHPTWNKVVTGASYVDATPYQYPARKKEAKARLRSRRPLSGRAEGKQERSRNDGSSRIYLSTAGFDLSPGIERLKCASVSWATMSICCWLLTACDEDFLVSWVDLTPASGSYSDRKRRGRACTLLGQLSTKVR
jgi:hypothetical protein